jgi:hypothetical protein
MLTVRSVIIKSLFRVARVHLCLFRSAADPPNVDFHRRHCEQVVWLRTAREAVDVEESATQSMLGVGLPSSELCTARWVCAFIATEPSPWRSKTKIPQDVGFTGVQWLHENAVFRAQQHTHTP